MTAYCYKENDEGLCINMIADSEYFAWSMAARACVFSEGPLKPAARIRELKSRNEGTVVQIEITEVKHD